MYTAHQTFFPSMFDVPTPTCKAAEPPVSTSCTPTLAFPTLVPVYPDQPNRPLPHQVTSLDLPGYNKYVEIKLYVKRVYPTPVHSTMSSSAWQQRSSGAALRARPEMFACLPKKSETSGGGCFQFIGHFCPRLGWTFLQLIFNVDGSHGLRCTVGDNRYATKPSNPSKPCVPIRTRITTAKSTRTLSARAAICAQNIL